MTSKDGHTHHGTLLLQAVGWFSLLDKLYMPSLSQHRWSFQWGTADTSLRFHSKSCPQYTPLQDRTYRYYTAAVSHRIKHIIANNITKKFKESVTFATTSLQMPQNPLSVPLFCQNLTTVILCHQAVQIDFLTNCKRSKILQQNLSSKLRSRNTSNPFFKNSTGYQSTQESSTKSQPCATILSLKLTHSICLNFWLSTIHPDNFALS